MIDPEGTPSTPAGDPSAGNRANEPANGPADGPAIAAVVPAWGRPADVVALFGDLERLEPAGRLRVVLVDNGSKPALEQHPQVAAALERLRARVPVRVVRLAENRGGSGGFNAGMAAALAREATGGGTDDAGGVPDYCWLVDSDARVEPGCLRALVTAAERRGPVAAVGASIADPKTGRVFETGGRLDRKTGRLVAQAAPAQDPIEVDYAAACCLLVPRDAIDKAGLMPDLFLHSDDVAFGLRLRRATGRRVIAAPAAKCRHPRFDRYKTWARYYEARNWVVPAGDAGLGVLARLRRSWREVVLGIGQTLIGRDDLSHLHTRGLADAAAGRVTGAADQDRIRVGRTWPFHALMPTLESMLPAVPPSAQPIAAIHADAPLKPGHRQQVRALLSKQGFAVADTPARDTTSRVEALSGILRTVLTPPAAVAVVNAKAPPHAWSAGRVIVAVSPGGFSICKPRTVDRAAAIVNILWRGLVPALRLAVSPPRVPKSPPATTPGPAERRPTLSVIILTRDRITKLITTIEQLESDPVGREAEIVVVDNGSSDGTPSTIAERFPRVVVVETNENLGVEGFNVGVARSTGEAVLILDDDAWPAPGALAGVLDLLRDKPEIGGVMMHRRHPKTNDWEWPFESEVGDTGAWPDMGSGNVIRRSAWDAVGGYEAGYFLYRNDTDLALKLLAAGHEVEFAKQYHVWHDSPIAKTKSAPWLWRSTRNWVWLCKRHGKAGSGVVAILFGWAWAHRLAGLSPAKQLSALRGVIEGLATKAPPTPRSVNPDGRALRRLVRLKIRHRG